jgi:uncharacterized protein YceK
MSIRTLRFLLFAYVVLIALSGCATINSKSVDGIGYPFAGMQDTFTSDNFSCLFRHTSIFGVFFLIDIPFSLVADVLLLPWDLAQKKVEPKPSRACQ